MAKRESFTNVVYIHKRKKMANIKNNTYEKVENTIPNLPIKSELSLKICTYVEPYVFAREKHKYRIFLLPWWSGTVVISRKGRA
jgi:hypothetical protein